MLYFSHSLNPIMRDLEPSLTRWTSAGLIDQAAAERIRAYEQQQSAQEVSQSRLSWQVLLALIFGAILLCAGVLLFVAAHWDQISPLARFALVLAMVTLFHVAGAIVRPHFDGLGIALHAVGTLSTGAAIALTGQIFNINEHWPGAILLWAIAALAGWWLLRDQVQQTLALLLAPAWVMCELLDRFGHYAGTEVYMLRLTAVLAALFLTAWQHSKQKVVYGILFAVSAFNLLYACPVLGEEAWRSYSSDGFLPLHDRFIFWALTAALFAAAWFFNRHSLLPVAVVTAVTILLPFAHSLKTNTYNTGNGFSSYTQTIPNAFFYLLLAISAAFFAWWGVRQSSKALINYGIICFALTVLYFYFSDLLDKLDRSFGLMLGGVLFLTGGWLLEWMRRRLVRSIGTAEAAS